MNILANVETLTTKEAALAGGVIGALLIGVFVYYIFVIIGLWKIFAKAGVKGWKSLIPIYNLYCAFKIVGLSPWWILWSILVSLLESVVFILALGNNAEAFWNAYLNNASYTIPESVACNPWVIITTILTVVVGLYVSIRFYARLARAFGKGKGFAVGLFFLSGIFTLILGFGSAKYDKKILKD